jgi:hypothetical protein
MRRARWLRERIKAEFPTEEVLCAKFRRWAEAAGWVVHPEPGDYDLVLVKDGLQIGVQAKRAGTLKLIYQCLGNLSRRERPDAVVALVPDAAPRFRHLLFKLGIGGIDVNLHTPGRVDFRLPSVVRTSEKQIWLPEYVSHAPAGVKSPKSLSRWRLKAIRMSLLLRERKEVTTKDFRRLGLAVPLWVDRWVVRTRRGCYALKPNVRLPDEDFPEVAAAILAKEGVSCGSDQGPLFEGVPQTPGADRPLPAGPAAAARDEGSP